MAYEIPLQKLTLIAAADLSAKQYYFVKVDSAGKAALCGAGEPAIGVLQNKPTAGQAAEIMCLGVSKVLMGGSITAGANVASDASGMAVNQTGGAATLAVALDGGSATEYGVICLAARPTTGTVQANSVLALPINLASITAAGDVLTTFTPGFAGTITKIVFAVTVPVTTGSKGATLNAEIGTTNLTGGVVTLTSANCTPLGAIVAGTAVTGNNVFGAGDSISIEAASVTAFTEGAGVLLISLG